MLKELKEISKEMNSQNVRMTQNVLFAVISKTWHGTMEDESETVRAEYEGAEEHYCESCYDKSCNSEDMPEFCIDCGEEAFHEIKYGLDLQAGVFFTAKACQEHIDANGYHYSKPKVYGIGAWRNPEMLSVQRYLSSLTGEVRSCYK